MNLKRGFSREMQLLYTRKGKELPLPSIMGNATIINPDALHKYFIRNCSNITYHNFCRKIKFTCCANDL